MKSQVTGSGLRYNADVYLPGRCFWALAVQSLAGPTIHPMRGLANTVDRRCHWYRPLLFGIAFGQQPGDSGGYIGALKAYSDALHPGMMRKDVEDYFRSRNTKFIWMWTALGEGRESQYADLVKIGKETAPLVLKRGGCLRHFRVLARD